MRSNLRVKDLDRQQRGAAVGINLTAFEPTSVNMPFPIIGPSSDTHQNMAGVRSSVFEETRLVAPCDKQVNHLLWLDSLMSIKRFFRATA